MQYRVGCECGDCVFVEESAAGRNVLCRCGRHIVIPRLRELRRQAGVPESSPSPELEVEALLLAGKLPQEHHCVLCGVATDASICCRTVCELARVREHRSVWGYILGFLAFGWLGLALGRAISGAETEWGKDRIFLLPLRICDACRQTLSNPAELKQGLRRVALYQRLLKKYPDARVSLVTA
jgi:hypothetical protein